MKEFFSNIDLKTAGFFSLVFIFVICATALFIGVLESSYFHTIAMTVCGSITTVMLGSNYNKRKLFEKELDKDVSDETKARGL
ncbi:MAG: hypothetical protein AB8G11_22390 [Saprospiraceae bacterium]